MTRNRSLFHIDWSVASCVLGGLWWTLSPNKTPNPFCGRLVYVLTITRDCESNYYILSHFNYFYLRLSINISLIYVHNWRVGSLIYVHNWRAGSLIYVHNWSVGSLIYVHNWRVGSLIYVHNWRVGSLIYVHNWRVGTIRLNGEYHDMLLNKVQTIS